MSLYNMINGYSPAVALYLPMLGKAPADYPRFRDCFLGDENHPEYDWNIIVYTRTGGGNREDYAEQNEEMQAMETFVADYDDDYDSTYACWVFRVPEKWKADFDAIKTGQSDAISQEYKDEIKRVFPTAGEHIVKGIEQAAAAKIAQAQAQAQSGTPTEVSE